MAIHPDALNVLAPALENNQKDVQLLALAGESYLQVRDFARASEFFQRAAALVPNAANLRTSLGLSKLGKGEHAQAIEDLRNAAQLDTKSPYAGIALVRTELGLGHYERALAAAEDMERAQPQNAVVQELKGMVYRAQEKTDLARRSFEKALQLQPSQFSAAAALAQMDITAKKPEAARARLTSFLEKNKSHTDAMTALAALASADGKVAESTQWLEKAVAAAPDAVAPTVRLITQYLVTGDKQKALTLARKIQLAHPENPDLLDLLGKSQLANGERSEALESYKKLAVALPRSANAQMQVAALQIVMGKHLAAEDTLKTVLAMQPDFPAAQLAQAELYVRRGSHELALMTASRLQRNYPKASAGYQLEGDILISQNKPALALASYEKAYALTKSTELMIKCVNAMRAAGRQQDAARTLAQWLSAHPDDVRAQLYKGETLLADRQYRQAAEHLNLTLQREPKNVTALNDLAWAYQQAGDERALPIAEEAYRVAGEQPVVMDTLGWILVEKGDAARGVQILQKASIQAPQARDIRYHMAVGLFRTGDKAGARKELQQLMSGDTRFAQADEARALLQKLQ
ncbi:XrtA/PEP-CTERM system TPR-repeat protein PrsT [Pseudoduganella sp. UC29_106]|uniref:XrtA/PEP-CTERM system TPR-repeat protein PrsT n=1 Tax=Pseudoduganella sp. UC29_106 TaxID=3374553 RepID=UPI003756C925